MAGQETLDAKIKRLRFGGNVKSTAEDIYEKRVVFTIKCQAMDENHAVKVTINNYVKFDDYIVKQDVLTTIEVSIALDKLGLNNSLTIIDKTTSLSSLYIYSALMSVKKVYESKVKKGKKQGADEEEEDSDLEGDLIFGSGNKAKQGNAFITTDFIEYRAEDFAL